MKLAFIGNFAKTKSAQGLVWCSHIITPTSKKNIEMKKKIKGREATLWKKRQLFRLKFCGRENGIVFYKILFSVLHNKGESNSDVTAYLFFLKYVITKLITVQA
jgi:hypothetical protein